MILLKKIILSTLLSLLFVFALRGLYIEDKGIEIAFEQLLDVEAETIFKTEIFLTLLLVLFLVNYKLVAYNISSKLSSDKGMKFGNPVPSKNYQAHIDGLRALAILPVFFYHLNPSYCSGGFGGVDVFFVISGYLISLGIFKNLDRGTFSLLDFYDKRIRRIIPIYTVTIVCVLLIAPVTLYPDMLKDLADLAKYGTFFMANIELFSTSQDYFAQGQSPNALTNLWSLSVEEQFYIFLPIFLILSYKFARKYILHLLGFVFAISFGLILYHFFTNSLVNEAFYLLPFRMYELLMGSFLAYFTLKNTANSDSKPNAFWKKTLALIAFEALIVTYYLFDKTDLFPSLWAFVLCIFAVILIKYGNLGATGAILRSTPLVFIGRISYSIYLIHFPLIVIWNFIQCDSLKLSDEILITIITILVATLTWILVELPIRRSKTWTRKKSFILLAFTTLSIIALVQTYYWTNSFREHFQIRVSVGRANIQTKKIDISKDKIYIEKFSSFVDFDIIKLSDSEKQAETLIIGDSHKNTLLIKLDEEFTRRNMPICTILKQLNVDIYPAYLKGKNDKINSVLDYLDKNPSIKNLMIIHRWTYRKDLYWGLKENPELFYEEMNAGLIKLVKELNRRGLNVFITSTSPEPFFNIGRYANRRLFSQLDNTDQLRISKDQYRAEHANIDKALNLLEKENLAKIIRIEKPFEKDDFYIFEDGNGKYYYFDDDHLSQDGASLVVPYLVEEFIRMSKENEK